MSGLRDRVDGVKHALNGLNEANSAFLWTGGKESQAIAHLLLQENADVPFVTVETGNCYEEVENFRQQYWNDHRFDWIRVRNEDLLEKINDDDDPRGYHGSWNSDADKVGEVDISQSEWTVDESCGKLKTEPIRQLVEELGYDTLITGTRHSDPVVSDNIQLRTQKTNPTPHTRVNPLHDWGEVHVWAYIKREFVDLPEMYYEGYSHTDSKCCTDDDQIGEHDQGFDIELQGVQEDLEDMGYI